MSQPDPTKSLPSAPEKAAEPPSHSTKTVRETVSFLKVSVSEEPASAPPEIRPLPAFDQSSRYEIRKPLGSGAFGSVNLAWDNQLQREVAIKRPLASLSASEKRSLLSEAQLAARVRHPAVVVVHDAQVDDRGDPFIVYEYLPGNSLRQKMHDQKHFSVRQALELTMTIADGLAAAHKMGLTHRDLKPGNILLDEEGRPRIADFGMACQDVDQHELRGQIAGTQKYMSPEQVRGESHLLDGRTDLWALGIILYELLTGKHPFTGSSTLDVAEQILQRDPRPPRQWVQEIPPEVEAIVLKLLAKPIEKRYGSASEVLEELRSAHDRLAELEESAAQPQASTSVSAWQMAFLSGLALASALVIWLVIAASVHREKVSYLNTNYRPGVWNSLLHQDRGFGEILNSAVTNRFWSKDGESLFVHATERAMLQLGEVHSDNFTLEVFLKPTSPKDELGLFLGYGPDKKPGYDRCTLLNCVETPNAKGRTTLQPRSMVIERGGSQDVAELRQLAISEMSLPAPADGTYVLHVEVRDGQIAELDVNNNPISFPQPERIRQLTTKGLFGIYVFKGSGNFNSVKIRITSKERSK